VANFKELTEQDVLALSAAFDEPDWLRDRRLEAFKAFSDLEWPHKRIEEWRYTDPARFDLQRAFVTAAGNGTPDEGGLIAAAGDLDGQVRIVDGAVTRAVVCAEALEQGVVVTDLASAARDHADLVREHLGSAAGTETKFGALSLAAATGSAVVIIPANVVLTRPIGISVEAAGDGAIAPRVLVIAGHHARAIVYVEQTGAGTATVLSAVETVLGDEARVDLVTAQRWGSGVDHLGAHVGRVGRSGDYRHLEVTLGGGTVYLTPDVQLVGEGAHGELLGVYFADDGQHFEHRSLIHHDASHTTSEEVYKGALQGDSRATWYGNIRIEPHAKATASDETNRNLILSDGARANTIPFLEILTSDVSSCGHHSSVGQVDAIQLFYLESRGIPRAEAIRMLLYGFFSEVVDRLDLPGVTEVVMGQIESDIRVEAASVLSDPRRGGAGGPSSSAPAASATATPDLTAHGQA
jgi:Fe-S cluster assembly protein SufD